MTLEEMNLWNAQHAPGTWVWLTDDGCHLELTRTTAHAYSCLGTPVVAVEAECEDRSLERLEVVGVSYLPEGSEHALPPEQWAEQIAEDLEVGDTVPKEVQHLRPWTPEELAAIAAKEATGRLDEVMNENEEVTFWEYGSPDDWPSVPPEVVKAVEAALLPWAKTCHASCLASIGTFPPDVDWSQYGLIVDEAGVVLEVES